MTCEGESTPWLFSVFLPTFYYFFCSFSECTDTKQILEWQYFWVQFRFLPAVRCGNKTQDGCVKSANATSVLCCPHPTYQDAYRLLQTISTSNKRGENFDSQKKSWAIKKLNSKFDFQKKINFDENIRRLFLTEVYLSTKLGRFWLI